LFGSTVAITISEAFEPSCVSARVSDGRGRSEASFDVIEPEYKESAVSYLRYCRFLS